MEVGGELYVGQSGNGSSHPADRCDYLGEGVLGGYCISQDGGVQRSFVLGADQSRHCHHFCNNVKDAIGRSRVGEPVSPQGEDIGRKSFIVEGNSKCHRPVEIGSHLFHGFSFRETLQDLECHDRSYP